MKQTAVEWLIQELNQKIDFISMDKWDMIIDIVQQAKEMEKEQMNHIVDINKMVSSKTEISDEEIEKDADNTYVKYNSYAIEGFIDGAKWYREQLKQRQ